jgi:hypothetical protein
MSSIFVAEIACRSSIMSSGIEWAIQNGDLAAVKRAVETQVCMCACVFVRRVCNVDDDDDVERECERL